MAHYYAFGEEVDTWQEHCSYEFNARFDYLAEAYGAEARMLAEDAAQEEKFYNELANTIGPLPEIYVSLHSAEAWYEMQAHDEALYGEALQAWALGGGNPEDKPSRDKRVTYDFDMPF